MKVLRGLAALILAGVVSAACTSMAAPKVVFYVNGPSSEQGNSDNAAWQTEVHIRSGSSYITASGSTPVICRILVNDVLVAEAQAAGAGQTARCAFNT